jgi:hypothetical protein
MRRQRVKISGVGKGMCRKKPIRLFTPSFAALWRRAAGDNRGSIKYRLPLLMAAVYPPAAHLRAIAFEGFTLEFDQVKTIVERRPQDGI